MAQARVVILNEVSQEIENDWNLCFHYCRYEYGDGGGEQNGYRFIWRYPNGNLQGARGQARIPSVADMLELTSKAMKEGWAHHICNSTKHENIEE